MREVRPATARTLLRRALRDLREQHGLAVGDLAREMEWSVSKGIRIESGVVAISVAELVLLLDRFGVRGPRREELLALRRTGRRRPLRPFADIVPGSVLRFLELESEAESVVQYDPTGVPILLASSAHLADLAHLVPPPVDRRRWAELMGRRRSVLADDGPDVLLVAHADALDLDPGPWMDVRVAQVEATPRGRVVVLPAVNRRWRPPTLPPVTVIRAAGRLLVHWGWITQGGSVIEDQAVAADVLGRVLAMVPDGDGRTTAGPDAAGCPQVGSCPQAGSTPVAAGRSGPAR